MGFDYFDLRNTDPGVAEMPTTSPFVGDWEGTPPNAYMRTTGYRSPLVGRGYFPTGITVPAKPRFTIELSTIVNDLDGQSFGQVFVGLTGAAPPNITTGNTVGAELTAPLAGVLLHSDTDFASYRAIYPYALPGGSGEGTPRNINSYLNSGTMVINLGTTEDGRLAMTLDGVTTYTPTVGAVVAQTWTHFVVGAVWRHTGTSGGANSNVDFDYRVHSVDLRPMHGGLWVDDGSTSPMVMG